MCNCGLYVAWVKKKGLFYGYPYIGKMRMCYLLISGVSGFPKWLDSLRSIWSLLIYFCAYWYIVLTIFGLDKFVYNEILLLYVRLSLLRMRRMSCSTPREVTSIENWLRRARTNHLFRVLWIFILVFEKPGPYNYKKFYFLPFSSTISVIKNNFFTINCTKFYL